MAQDPRSLLTTDRCAPIKDANVTSNSRAFIDGLGKIGDLEVLNDIGGARVGEGLRVLKEISDVVRSGKGSTVNPFTGESISVPSFVGQTIDKGITAVTDTLGIAQGVVDQVNRINPGVTNRALQEAKNLYERVRQGDLDISDAPSIVADIINLEKLGRKIFIPGDSPSTSPQRDISCFGSPYAEALAYEYAPKYKFLFIVEFIQNDFAVNGVPQTNRLNETGNNAAFLIKTSTRPNMRIDYEDLNMYNYRTKVAKRTEYDPMTMTFYDDQQNNSTQFFTDLLNIHNPISRQPTSNQFSYEQNGLNFDSSSSASYGPIEPITDTTGNYPEHVKTPFSTIRLFHIFNYGLEMNVYHFVKPKITEIQSDDLDMASSEISEIQLQFSYDALRMETDVPVHLDAQSVSSGGTEGSYDVTKLTSLLNKIPLSPIFDESQLLKDGD